MILFALDQILYVPPGLAFGPGKGDLEIGHPRIGKPLELVGIQEVILGVAATEEQDRLPDRGPLLLEVGPLLKEAAEGGHAGARPDHDHRQMRVGRWVERNGGPAYEREYSAALHA